MRILFYLLLSLAGFSCGNNNIAAQNRMDPAAFDTLLATGNTVQLIDVRTPEEYKSGHLKNARLINFHQADFVQQLEKLDKEVPVLVYCAVGGRSGKTASKLMSMGFTQVYDLDGGINAWKAAGKAVVK